MATQRIPAAGDPFSFSQPKLDTRELRGLELYRRGGIERISRDVFVVPSRSRRDVAYTVHVRRESCQCQDHKHRHEPCMHLYAAMLYASWLRKSARVVGASLSGAFSSASEAE